MFSAFTEIPASEWLEKLKAAQQWAMMTDLKGCRLELVVMHGETIERYKTPDLVAMDGFEYDIFMIQLKQLDEEYQARRIL